LKRKVENGKTTRCQEKEKTSQALDPEEKTRGESEKNKIDQD
jgi:hypothetical protein